MNADQWRPIESVPLGKKVLRYIPEQPADARGHNDLAALMDIGFGAGYGNRKATHWMPLPDAPRTEGTP